MTDKKTEEVKKEKPTSVPLSGTTAGEKEIQEKLEESEKKAAEYLAGWQRARADFLNYKKEEIERVGEFMKYANEEFVSKVLPILDNFTEAEKSIPDNKKDNYLKGISQIKRQFEDFLKSRGVEEVNSVGEKFDPNFHEIIGEVSPSEA
ncbi:MAG: nucleotide exchange factor GrpE, partial [Patescibacteria group bacterium]